MLVQYPSHSQYLYSISSNKLLDNPIQRLILLVLLLLSFYVFVWIPAIIFRRQQARMIDKQPQQPMRLLLSLFLCLLCCSSSTPSLFVDAQLVTYYMCATLQSSNFSVVLQAVLTVNRTAILARDYYGDQSPAYRAMSLQSGSRQYTDLTSSPPVSTTIQMANLIPPNTPYSTGGNDNLYFPTVNPAINGNGFTFNFTQPVQIGGQKTLANYLNLWWWDSYYQLDESTLYGAPEQPQIFGSQITFSTHPIDCVIPSYAQFTVCLYTAAHTYSTLITTIINTTGTATRVTGSASNPLSQPQQGFLAESVSGNRIFTDRMTGVTTNSQLIAIAEADNVVNNDNYLFPDSPLIFDGNGIGFIVSPAAPIAGQTDAVNGTSFALKAASAGVYYEQQISSQNETSCTSVFAKVDAYRYGQPTSCKFVNTGSFYSYSWSMSGIRWSSVITGFLTINPFRVLTASGYSYRIIYMSGIRTFTENDVVVSVSTIISLAPVNSLGSNSNLLYMNNSYASLDFAGITLIFDSVPPMYQANSTGVTNTQLNLYRDGGYFSEANVAGKQMGTSGSFTIYPTINGTAPSCPNYTNTIPITKSSSSSSSSAASSASTSGGHEDGNHSIIAAVVSVLGILLTFVFVLIYYCRPTKRCCFNPTRQSESRERLLESEMSNNFRSVSDTAHFNSRATFLL